MRSLIKYGIVISVVMSSYAGYTNVEPLCFEDFEEIVSQIDYTKKTKRKLSLKEFERNQAEEKNQDLPSLRGFESIGEFMNIIAYLLIIVLVGTIVYFLIRSIEPADQKIMYEDKMIEEEDIENIDAQQLYLNALDEKDYRTAIRMRFILILQDFSERQLIDWKPEKTNRDYKRELRASNEYKFFTSASNIYDRIWYGHNVIALKEFEKLNSYFELNSSTN